MLSLYTVSNIFNVNSNKVGGGGISWLKLCQLKAIGKRRGWRCPCSKEMLVRLCDKTL